MRSKMERVYVPYFCERCGRTEFEGTVFGVFRVRHLQAEPENRTMLCNRCRDEPKMPKCQLSSFFFQPAEATND